MVRGAGAIALAGLVSGLAVVATTSPAAAATTVTSSGTVVTVNAPEVGTIGFSCDGTGAFSAGNVKAVPAVSCSVVTRVEVNGGTGAQTVVGSDLDLPKFAAHPYLVATMGVGEDRVIETQGADTIDMGPGDDTVFIAAGGLDNPSVTLGTGTADTAYFVGTPGNDTITASSTGSTVSATASNEDGGSTRTIQAVDLLYLKGEAGSDTISAPGISAASSIDTVHMLGGTGDDTLTASAKPGTFYGNEGTNTFNGSAADATYTSWSDTDVINAGPTVETVEVADRNGGRSGGRTITGAGAWRYTQFQDGCDAQSRVRPASGGRATVTSSLCRPGIQVLPSSVSRVSIVLDDAVRNQGLADVVIPGSQKVSVDGGSAGHELLDLTVPTGGWTVAADANQTTVTPTAGWGAVAYRNVDDVAIHGPWADANQSFSHRVVRDLLFRFPQAGPRDAVRAALANGTTTRAKVVTGIMATDEYRGLDVDRVFVRFLKRPADPSGRTYWINSLRSGKSLQKFRAQLFGSSEYLAKAGGTDRGFVRAAYFDVLGRLPDPSGEAYWTNKIANGTDRGSVADAFLASTEARRAIVKDQFQRFVLRLPTSSESEQWVATLAQPTGENQLIAFLAASNSYLGAG